MQEDTDETKTTDQLSGDGNLSDLTGMNAEKAIEYVSGVPNVDALKRYLSDKRTTVVKAVQAQLQVLSDLEEKDEEKDD